MSSASLMQIDQNDSNTNTSVSEKEEKWFDLKLNRDLLDSNFEGYKLSLDTFPHYKLEMNNDLAVNTYNFVESGASSQKFFLYQHLKLFGMQNLLVVNNFNDANLYYFDETSRLVKIVYAMPKLIPVRSLVPTTFTLSSNATYNTTERTNATMKFVSEFCAIIFDGYDTLYLAEIEQTQNTKTEDPLVPEKWNILFTWTAKSEDKCYASLLKDAILFDNLKLHLLLASINVTSNNKYELLIHWLELTQIDSTKTWSITRKRIINCYESVPEYLALETNGQSVYIAAPSFVEFVYDSVKSVSTSKFKLKQNGANDKKEIDEEFKFKKEKFYAWTQTSDEINITVRLNTLNNSLGVDIVDKNSILVNYKTDFIEIKHQSQHLLNGHLFGKIKPDECVWTLSSSRGNGIDSIEIVLVKAQTGEIWTSCLKDHDEYGEYKSEMSVDNGGELKSEIADKQQAMESKTLFSLEQQLEECDEINDVQMSVGGGGTCDEQDKLVMLRRMDGDSHRVTHKCYINDNKFLFEVKTSANKCAALCLRHDVDGILWQPHRVSAPASTDTIWLTHEHTFKAFGYVQASKQDTKYRTCPPNLSYSCIVDTQKHIYVYKQDSCHMSSQLKNRKTGQLVTQLAKQNLISLETDKEIFGVYCSNNYIIVLLKESCYIYKINEFSKNFNSIKYIRMENKFVKLESASNWSDYTFVLACVSVGNIGQLATDLLISTLPGTKKAGYLISTLVQPIVGHDAYVQNSSELSVSCELYENPKLKLVLCQMRAPLFKGKRNEFVKVLVDFVKAEKIKETICLTSSHAFERLDSQLDGPQCRYLTSSTDAQTFLSNKLGWKLLEKRINHDLNHNLVENVENKLSNFIPGGGIAQKFLNTCQENNLNTYVLLVFAHEGNNIPEAFQLVNYLNQWKEYLTPQPNVNSMSQWRTPISWKYVWGDSRSLSQTY